MINKPIIVFINFWGANKRIGDCKLIIENKEIILQNPVLNPNITNPNFCIYSIALSHPNLKSLKNIHKFNKFDELSRLDFFCPTYDILKNYKDQTILWDDYDKKFKNLIKRRKNEIVAWVNQLENNMIYFLCCWENTSGKANCHRRILYDAMTKSKKLNNSAIYVYFDN
jgi:uncharacterized protein YeaO (DUF488 family)